MRDLQRCADGMVVHVGDILDGVTGRRHNRQRGLEQPFEIGGTHLAERRLVSLFEMLTVGNQANVGDDADVAAASYRAGAG